MGYPQSLKSRPEPASRTGPLEDTLVYELAGGVAVSATGRALADLGAEVVKVSVGTEPASADAFELLDVGKRRMSVSAESLTDWLASVVTDADGVLLDRDFDSASFPEHPAGARGCVVVRFDPDLPAGASAARILHGSGQTSIDTRGTIPVAPPGNIPYYDAAMTGVFAFLATRWPAAPEAGGATLVIRIDTNSVEIAHGRPDLTRAANEAVSGERDPFLALFLQCSDGEIASHINRNYFSKWLDLIGRPELDADPRFITMIDLLDNQDEAVAEVEQWCGQRTRYEIENLCQERGIPVGSVLRPEEVTADRQLVHRSFVGPDGRPAFLPFLLSDGTRWRSAAGPTDSKPSEATSGDRTLAAS